ncbi:hypothetical protein ACROYT_G019116 [Oculina patagonica]
MANVSLSSSTNSSDPDIEECHHLQGLVWHKTYLTEHTYRHLVVLICVNSLAVVFTILLNALVIFVVTTRRRLQTNSNILLACLAGTDLLVGLTVQPIGIAGLAKRAFGIQPFCTVETVFAIALFASWYASLSHLVLISIDRYIAVKDALRYREIVTRQRIKKAVLVAWAIAVFFPENRAPDIEMVEIQRHRPEIQPSACEAFSMAAVNQEPVLLSFSNLNPDEIVHIEEMDN